MKICFATNNKHKIEEVSKLLGTDFQLLSLEEIGCNEELPEEQDTLEGNSRQKAEYVYDHYGISCFADDTGLEVEALGGDPGVYSARYAGSGRNGEKNIALLMKNLSGIDRREAQFRTVITFIGENKEFRQFEGVVEGRIISEKLGEKGFGYDPVFLPKGHNQTFAQMALEEKNKISHRALAVNQLVSYLKSKHSLH